MRAGIILAYAGRRMARTVRAVAKKTVVRGAVQEHVYIGAEYGVVEPNRVIMRGVGSAITSMRSGSSENEIGSSNAKNVV